jgi:hypothetical protein
MSALECHNCGAALELPPHLRTATCFYCGAPSVVERPPAKDRPVPSLALGFVLPRERALEIARAWVMGAWFAPGSFRKARVEVTQGLYVPAYLYTAVARSTYRAEIGENYTVSERYTTTDSKGNRVTRTRTRTETEWRSLVGEHAAYVADRVVTASRGISNDELEETEPFDLRALVRYSPKLISGWVAEDPSLSLEQCLELARSEALTEVGRAIDGFMPGDRHRNVWHQTAFSQENLELSLLPLWVLPVRYGDDKLARLLVNGQTGKLCGRAPVSALKVATLVLVLLALIAAIVLAVMGRSP